MVLFAFGCSGSETSDLQPGQQAETVARPNIIFILADDLDLASAQQMPKLRSLLTEEGASFENAFLSFPLCCPSRTTILTGLYAHNHRVASNEPPGGGFEKFHEQGLEENTIATRLHADGYRTALIGKYLNHYPGDHLTYVPPGWDDWHASSDIEDERVTRYYDYTLNENGELVPYGNSPEDYLTDVLSGQASDFVRHAASDSELFFLYLAPAAPHDPASPAERQTALDQADKTHL